MEPEGHMNFKSDGRKTVLVTVIFSFCSVADCPHTGKNNGMFKCPMIGQ